MGDVATLSCQVLAKNQTNVSALNIKNTLHCRYCEIFLRLQKSLFLNLITLGSVLEVFYLGLIILSIFIMNVDHRMKGILSKLVDATMRAAVGMLKGRAARREG